MRSVFDAVRVLTAIRPHTRTGTGTPAAVNVIAVDTFGYNSALFDVVTGTPTGTAVTYVVSIKLQECTTSGGTYADITGAIGTMTGTTTTGYLRAQIRLENLGTPRARYIKVYALVTMTANDGQVLPIAAQAVLGHGYKVPVANAAASSTSS